MNLFKKLAGDSLWLLIGRIGAQGAMVAVTSMLARRMGASGFGEYAFIAAVVAIGNVLTTFGSDMVLIREIAAKGDFSDVTVALVIQLVLASGFIGCVFLFARSFPGLTGNGILAAKIISFALIPLAFFTVFTSILRGLQRMISYAWLNLGVAFLQVSAVMIFVRRGTGIVDLAYVLLGVQAAGALLAGLSCAPLFPDLKSGHVSLARLFPFFMVCMPVAWIAALGILYQKSSLAMLAFLGTSTMTGAFSASARVVDAARLGHIAFFTALYPALANLGARGVFHQSFRSSWALLIFVSTLASLLIFLLSGPIVEIFYGSEYQASVLVLKILAFTLIPYTANAFLSLAYLAMQKEHIVLRIFAASLFTLVILNFWFIPFWGESGAACAILIAESLQMVMFVSVWMKDRARQTDMIPAGEGSYEFSDLS